MIKIWEEKLVEKDKINQVRVLVDLELGYKNINLIFNDIDRYK